MQLNPARGRKLDVWRRHAATRISRRGLCSSTPRGDGNVQSETREPSRKPVGLCSSTPRGDGNPIRAAIISPITVRFMQLNPARGRKPVRDRPLSPLAAHGFMQLNPARGRKLLSFLCHINHLLSWFMQLNPARGRKRAER